MKEDWIECKFEEITINYDGKRKPLSREVRERFKGEFPYYGACEIIDYVKEFLFDGKYLLIGEDGANLLSKSKPLSFIATGKFWVNNHAHIVQPQNGINLSFLNYQFNSLQINPFVTGTAQPKLNQRNLNKIPVNIPPLPIQRAIVSKIETLFSDLDNGISDLIKAQEQLKIYRQAVLKKAFEGELTKAWREQQSNLPTAEELLEQIKQERQNHYEQQLENWKQAVKTWEENGKEGKKPSKPKKITEAKFINNESLEELVSLPHGWFWIKNIDFALKITDGEHITPKRTESGYYLLSARNIQNGYISYKTVDYVGQEEYDRIRKRCNPEYGDILISCSGSVGRVSHVPKENEFVMVRSVALVKYYNSSSYLFTRGFTR